jgi:hypothetical protein
MDEKDAAGGAPPTPQYHLKLDDPDLLVFVRHMANRVWRGIAPQLPAEARSAGTYLTMRRAIEEELREHVVGMDLCGLAAVCAESEEYDPWPVAETLPSGLIEPHVEPHVKPHDETQTA